MTHDHKDGCCGTDKENCNTSCCGSRGWVTGLAIIVAIAAVGYALTHRGPATSLNGEFKKPKADASTLITGEDSVIAKLNGKDIHKSDVAQAIKDLGANVPPANIDQILPAFTDQYINLQLINDAAMKAGVMKEPDVQAQLASSQEQIVRAAYLRELFDGKITDDTLKAAYKAKYEDQPMPEEVHARHILVDNEDKAKDLINQLNHGANFEKLAAENSKDPSASRGGDLGYFTKGEMVKEFGDAAFAMAPGQISKTPVKTQFGWHVIKVEDKRTRAKPSFEEAKPALEQEARQALLDAKLKELREQAKVEILPAAVAGQTAPGAAPAGAVPTEGPQSTPGNPAPAPAPAPEAVPAPAPAPAPAQ